MKRLLVAFLILITGKAHPQQLTYDLLIKNGRVLDGTGNPWFYADVAVKDGKIAAIGKLEGAKATRTIDATGTYVVPGFIDLHSHADNGLADSKTRTAPNKVAQGITTVVVNQDGRSPDWPIAKQKQTYEKQGIGVNAVLLVGHGTVRQMAMKNDFRRPATQAEIEEMKKLVRQGMEEGAYGLSAGLEYVPGRWSEPEEVIELAKVLAPYNGFYISHQRSEGRDPLWKVASDPTPSVDMLQAVQETIEIGRRAGITVVCSHLKAKGASYWGSSYAATRLIKDARDQGISVYADQYPYPTTGTDGETVLIPQWALVDEGVDPGGQLAQLARGNPARLKSNFAQRMENEELRKKIRNDIANEIDRRGGASHIIIYEFPDHSYIEQSLAQIAARFDEDPVSTAIRIQLTGFNRPGGARMRGFSLSEYDIEHIMQQEFTATCTDAYVVAQGDGVPHPRHYGSYPRKIQHYVFERGIISLPFAIRSMTSLPAQIIGLNDRGLIKEGYWADITIFDAEKIADKSTYTNPHQYPEGIPYVLVNGQVVVENGKLTGKLPGRVLSRKDGRADQKPARK
jgi:N-acyl-D-amino-acid deacylase